MKAAQYKAYGLPEVLEVVATATPQVKTGHVLIKVMANRVNAADLAIRSGKLKLFSGKKFPKGTGFDFAGKIIELGENVNTFKANDEVWGFINNIKQPFPSTTAEYVVAPINAIAHKPKTLDFISAAALSGAGGAALGVLNQGNIKHGDKVLIRGGAGGVGSVAVQIARAMGGRVTALVNAKHIQKIRDLGADEAYDYKTVKPHELGQFDVIFDTVGSKMSDYRALLKPNGRYLLIALEGFGNILYMLVSKIFGQRRIRFIAMPPDSKLLSSLTEYADNKSIKPIIEKIYSLEEITLAHRALEAKGVFGKIAIKISD